MKKLFSLLIVFILISCSKDPVIYTLTATANPAEGGTVSPSSQQYDSGDVATVTATASSEYVFQNWSGSASGSSSSTTVTMDSDKAVVANFVKKKYALTINVEGEGSVTEKVIKAGVATDYNSGTVVELTAVPEGEWLFVEWTGDLTGSENPKEITIDKAKTVTAVFVKKQYPLTIEIEGEGTVSEKVIKQGLATDYNSGTIVELTAEPTGDWEFVEWSGDITSTENPVQITIDGPKTVKVKFMRYFNYKVPSHDWQNDYEPWINRFDIERDMNLDYETFSGTGYAYADFNGDGYFDFSAQEGARDGILVPSKIFLSDNEGEFYYDENILKNPDFVSEKARKTIVGDFNGDGKPDVVRPAGQHDYLDYTYITLSRQDGYEILKINGVPQSQYHSLCSGDIDNDGDLDIFFGATVEDGFAINNGDGTFQWKYVYEVISNFELNSSDSPRGKHGLYGIWTSEMFDVNKDGNIDLIFTGFSEDYSDVSLNGPTIIWGDGSGLFDYDNKTLLYQNKKPTYNGQVASGNDDIVIKDIDGDGLVDFTSFHNFPDNSTYIEIIRQLPNLEFIDMTEEWIGVPENINNFPLTWIRVTDVDNNGYLDIVENSSEISRPGDWTGNSNSIRYEWNGSKFEKLN